MDATTEINSLSSTKIIDRSINENDTNKRKGDDNDDNDTDDEVDDGPQEQASIKLAKTPGKLISTLL